MDEETNKVLKESREIADRIQNNSAKCEPNNSRKECEPNSIWANGLVNNFTGMKRWKITCGNCEYPWADKIPIVENLKSICPSCGYVNAWSFTTFARMYDRQHKLQWDEFEREERQRKYNSKINRFLRWIKGENKK